MALKKYPDGKFYDSDADYYAANPDATSTQSDKVFDDWGGSSNPGSSSNSGYNSNSLANRVEEANQRNDQYFRKRWGSDGVEAGRREAERQRAAKEKQQREADYKSRSRDYHDEKGLEKALDDGWYNGEGPKDLYYENRNQSPREARRAALERDEVRRAERNYEVNKAGQDAYYDYINKKGGYSDNSTKSGRTKNSGNRGNKRRPEDMSVAELYKHVTGADWSGIKKDRDYGDMHDGSFKMNMRIRQRLLDRLKAGTDDYKDSRDGREDYDRKTHVQVPQANRPGEDLPDMPVRRSSQDEKPRRGLKRLFKR